MTQATTTLTRAASVSLCFGGMGWAQAQSTPGQRVFPPVLVDSTALEYRQFEKAEVTGSAILAKVIWQALPLQIIERRDIERSGAASLSELMQSLPVMSNYSESGSMTGTVSGGPETAAVHGNQSGTLVLLNGRRLPYYGSQTIMGERAVVDLNFVPLSAVERIEILTDGASSRYGSDAVAGVVNIITKAELQGLAISAETVMPQGGHGHSESVNLSWGKGRLRRNGYNFRAYFTAEKKDALLAGQREVSSQGARSVQMDGTTWWKSFNTSPYSAPAQNYLDATGERRNDHYAQTGQCEDGWYELFRGQCDKNIQGGMTLYPATEKHMLYVQADKVLDNRWVLSTEGLLGKQTQTSVPSGAYWTLDVPSADTGNTYWLDVVPLGLLKQQYTNQIHNAVMGLRGEQSGWDFVGSVSTGRHKVDRAYTGGLVQGALESVQLAPEVTGQDPAAYSASTLAAFEPYRRTSQWAMDTGWTRLDSFNFLASREWLDTAHGPVNLGLGLDWRHETVRYEAFGDANRPGLDAGRSNVASHLEIHGPTGPRSEVTGAVRHDQYSDFGSVQTGKLSWKWQAAPQWLFRASVGTGFRAPSLGQMAKVQSRIADHYDAANDAYVPIINQGNPQLKPERSVQKTWGVRFEPDPRLTVVADVWQVDIQDTFGVLSGTQILNNAALRAQFLLNGEIFQSNLNLGRSSKRGVDYDVQWRQVTALGRVRWSLKGIHMLKSVTQDPITGNFISNIGQSTDDQVLTTARHQWVLNTQLERAEWTGGVTLHYRSGDHEKTLLSDRDGNFLDYSAHIPAYWTADVSSRWQIRPGMSLSTQVMNLSNRMPQLRMAMPENILIGVSTRYASYMGRTLRLKLDYKF